MIFKKKTNIAPVQGIESFSKKVDSTSVESIAWNKDTKVFTIVFLKGGIYDYAGVTAKDAEMALKSSSYGNLARNELGAYKGVKRV